MVRGAEPDQSRASDLRCCHRVSPLQHILVDTVHKCAIVDSVHISTDRQASHGHHRHIAGSQEDPFEPRQIVTARERRAPFGVDIRMFPGGHLTTSEHPRLRAYAIGELAGAQGVGETTWAAAASPQRPHIHPLYIARYV